MEFDVLLYTLTLNIPEVYFFNSVWGEKKKQIFVFLLATVELHNFATWVILCHFPGILSSACCCSKVLMWQVVVLSHL